MRKAVVFSTSLIMYSLAAGGEPKAIDAIDLCASGLMEHLEATEVECPQDIADLPALTKVVCGQIPKNKRVSKHEFQNAIDEFIENECHSYRFDEEKIWKWNQSRRYKVKTYWASGSKFMVWEKAKKGHIILLYVKVCFDPPATPNPFGPESIFSPPVIIPETKTQPTYPPVALQLGYRGYVYFNRIIRKDGSMGELCLVGADPPDWGFADAAIEAVADWKFHPAEIEGEPIDVSC